MRQTLTRRTFTVAVFALAVGPTLSAAEYFQKTIWFEKKEGTDKPKDLEGNLQLDRDSKRILFFSENTKRTEIPLDGVTNLVYERAKSPRYLAGLLVAWPLFFTKNKKHFFTIQYKDEKGEGRYALFQLHKSNYRDVLAAFEAASGHKVERLEEN